MPAPTSVWEVSEFIAGMRNGGANSAKYTDNANSKTATARANLDARSSSGRQIPANPVSRDSPRMVAMTRATNASRLMVTPGVAAARNKTLESAASESAFRQPSHPRRCSSKSASTRAFPWESPASRSSSLAVNSGQPDALLADGLVVQFNTAGLPFSLTIQGTRCPASL